MEFATWNLQTLNIDGWGMTPLSLAAPFALITVILMGRRLSREIGPKMDKRDVGSAFIITAIIGGAFLWIFAGLGLLTRIFH
jgi:hypothetical protein